MDLFLIILMAATFAIILFHVMFPSQRGFSKKKDVCESTDYCKVPSATDIDKSYVLSMYCLKGDKDWTHNLHTWIGIIIYDSIGNEVYHEIVGSVGLFFMSLKSHNIVDKLNGKAIHISSILTCNAMLSNNITAGFIHEFIYASYKIRNNPSNPSYMQESLLEAYNQKGSYVPLSRILELLRDSDIHVDYKYDDTTNLSEDNIAPKIILSQGENTFTVESAIGDHNLVHIKLSSISGKYSGKELFEEAIADGSDK